MEIAFRSLTDGEKRNGNTFVVPNNVTTIDGGVFAGCLFERIVLPSTVDKIETNAFANCWRLKSLSIPPKVKVLKKGICAFCLNLENSEFPEGLELIEAGAFSNCPNLKQVEIPEGCEVEAGAFDEGCSVIFKEKSNEEKYHFSSTLTTSSEKTKELV